ncbi:hypothetical protein D3C71_1675720 [compost metagenome]
MSAVLRSLRAASTAGAVAPAATEKRVRSGDQVVTRYSVLPTNRLPTTKPSMRICLSCAGTTSLPMENTSTDSVRLYSGSTVVSAVPSPVNGAAAANAMIGCRSAYGSCCDRIAARVPPPAK